MSEIPWSHLITTDEVFELHQIGMNRYGGRKPGIRPDSADCVDGKLGGAWNSELYRAQETGYVQGLLFAGHLLYYLARSHCFVDGNKRVAWQCAMAVLAALGLTVKATQKEVENYVNLVANGEVPGGPECVLWISARLEAPEAPTYIGEPV